MHHANDNNPPSRPALPWLPRGLSRTEAAAYIGVSPSLFDAMVRDRRMPGPRLANSRTVWDRLELDSAFNDLPYRDAVNQPNPWDEGESECRRKIHTA